MYAIGDIHGCNKSFKALLELLPLKDGDTLILLGDLVGRGPDASGVLDTIHSLKQTYKVIILMGNHDSRFLHALGWNSLDVYGDERLFDAELHEELGGIQTLASYSIAPSDISLCKLPAEHQEIFSSMKLYHKTDDYLFIHGGLSKEALAEDTLDAALKHPTQDARCCLWERETCSIDHQLGVVIVHGHINHDRLVIERHGKLNLDTGCVWGRSLTAMKFPERYTYAVPCLDTIEA